MIKPHSMPLLTMNASIYSSHRHCVLLPAVAQPFARECHAGKDMLNDYHNATRVTQKSRSPISGCGMGAGSALVRRKHASDRVHGHNKVHLERSKLMCEHSLLEG